MVNFTDKCAKWIMKWSLLDNKNVTEEEKEVLVYGYTLFLENFIKTFVLVLVALITHTLFQTFIIIGSFGLLRSFSGGVHCRSGFACTLCMIGVWAVGLIVAEISIPLPILIIMSGITVWIILKYSPQSTKNNPILNVKIKKQKRMCSIIVVISLLIIGFISGVYLNRFDILNMILTSIFIEAFSILLLVEKEEADNEEEFKSSSNKAW